MDDALKQNITTSLGLDALDEKQREEAFLAVGRVVYQEVLTRVVELMSNEEMTAFEKILAENPNDQQAMFTFLQAKVPTLDEIVTKEITKFKQESSNLLNNIK